MPKLTGSCVKEFEFLKLEKNGKIDLLEYINTATILNRIPKAVKRIVTGLLATKRYKMSGTFLICNKKTMTDETNVDEVAETVTPETEVAETTDAETDKDGAETPEVVAEEATAEEEAE